MALQVQLINSSATILLIKSGGAYLFTFIRSIYFQLQSYLFIFNYNFIYLFSITILFIHFQLQFYLFIFNYNFIYLFSNDARIYFQLHGITSVI